MVIHTEVAMGHRVNVVLDEEAWRRLQTVPRGERSRFVSEAVHRAWALQRRREAAGRIEEIRARVARPEGATEEWVRADRERR